MNQSSSSTGKQPNTSPLAHALSVFWVLALCYLLLSAPAYWLSGTIGLSAAAVAAVACGLASIGAESVSTLFAFNGQPLGGMLSGMLVRMALPLIFVMIVYRQPGPLVDAGLVFYLIAFYMATLTADTRHAMTRIAGAAQPWEGDRGR